LGLKKTNKKREKKKDAWKEKFIQVMVENNDNIE
jgi:hypothetical protein